MFNSSFGDANMEASEPKWVNSISNNIEVNSFRLGGFHISISKWWIEHNFYRIYIYSDNIKSYNEKLNLYKQSQFL